MRKIVYLGYYDTDDNCAEGRNVVRAATTKMNYIMSKLVEIGYEVDVVSMSGTNLHKAVKGSKREISDHISLELLPSMGTGVSPKRLISRKLLEREMRQRLRRLNSDDVVIAYHSLGYVRLLREEKSRVGFRLVLEVEELYSDVTGKIEDKSLEESVFEAADGYLCSTGLLKRRLPKKDVPSAVCSGIYRMTPKVSKKFVDGKVHVVYAGTLDPRKGGAAAAAAAGAFLPSEYRMHILGFGNDDDVVSIRQAVINANKKSIGCEISYDGYLSGADFDAFVQSCHIGLSPQDPKAAFNMTSFPSKVFMYLSNGLPVVSVDLPVFEDTPLRRMLSIAEGNDPKVLSSAIINLNVTDARRIPAEMEVLDRNFGENLAALLGEVGNANR